MTDKPIPEFLETLFNQLRRRRFPLGTDDYSALQRALKSGFGWSSPQALRTLCGALWAKSRKEQEILNGLFDQLPLEDWLLPELVESEPTDSPTDLNTETSSASSIPRPLKEKPDDTDDEEEQSESETTTVVTQFQQGLRLPRIGLGDTKFPEFNFVFVPQFPLTYREVAQAWRRLRQPVRYGPPTELDIEATVQQCSRSGLISQPILLPRRRNTARLLMLIDVQGSMLPFQRYVTEVCQAIEQAGNLETVARYYFHDVPIEGADETVLDELPDDLFPTLDPILPNIIPTKQGVIYRTPDLLSSQSIAKMLTDQADDTAVVLLSDAGAARRKYDTLRLLDTVAFMKALRHHTKRYVWLNPLPRPYWLNSTASQIARHVPMFPLDQAGMYHAVNCLRGQPYPVDKPL